ncbi:cation:proton antiporter [Lutibacter sp. TH_r2]|uniref:cation:proton antiporter domain-containing protein n=1 Tax=Lutibacter sp. TH_r2 TaxID=3082083 RepID=UPI0029548011|nr:cation:proton antiporter [Lutibacter sp. TH_r2]MDV7186383.1 cation:proton antiporter [Lutibacter sp. TH_r2]
MFLYTQLDPTVAFVSVLAILIIIFGLILKRFKQPYIIGYIMIGALLGEHGIGLIKDTESIHHLGEIGIILLLFFIGMEISLPELVKQWKLAVIGTLLQVCISVLIVIGIGYFFNWNIQRSVILGFVIALSSSAVIIKIIQDKNLITTRIGKNVLSVLLMQDIIIVPLLIITSIIGGKEEPVEKIILMVVGGLLVMAILVYIYIKRSIKLPFESKLENDHELQVFAAILLCFGGALLASIFGLSPALGAFVGGMVMHVSKATDWIYDTLHSFRVLFVALFFVSIGLQIDFQFIIKNYVVISIVLLSVYLTNHFINSFILKLFSCKWHESILGGALLAQIGELSFLISSSAFSLGILGSFGYKFTISLISLTLLISPFYISSTEKLLKILQKKKLMKLHKIKK